jgi:hypothetical protein
VTGKRSSIICDRAGCVVLDHFDCSLVFGDLLACTRICVGARRLGDVGGRKAADLAGKPARLAARTANLADARNA